MKRILVPMFALIALSAIGQQSDLTKKMSIEQKLGDQVPMDTPVRDESGKTIRFGDVFHGRPVFFMPIFYTCRGVCDLEVHDFLKGAVKMKSTYPIGQKFDLVVLSINPKETPEIALAKEKQMQEVYDLPASAAGWHFLTADYDNIRKITDAVGFHYEYRERDDVINHPAGVMILTPEGRVSSYLYGSEYPTRIVEDGIALAANNKIGRPAEVILLGCVMVDPVTGKRTLIVKNVIKVAGIATVLALAGAVLKMSLAERKKGAAA